MIEIDDELILSSAKEVQQTNSVPGADYQKTAPDAEMPIQGTRLAVMAPYWIDGLHNKQGLALAEEVNQIIKRDWLGENPEAITKLVMMYPNAKRYGLEVVSLDQYLNDPHRKANMAEPRALLSGVFIRDKNGEYRPAAGGRVVLADKGDSLVLKDKSSNGYAAAMELAIAKGWTAIELNGKPAMLAEAWLEAKMKGLDVVNYSPTKEDLAKYSKRLASEQAVKTSQAQSITQDPEQVEMRPFVDMDGNNKVAEVRYTVSHKNGYDLYFDDPKEAAKAFAAISDTTYPSVSRAIISANGEFSHNEIIAGTKVNSESRAAPPSKVVFLDQKFQEAFNAILAAEKVKGSAAHELAGVASGKYSGRIVGIEDGYVIQKIGRGPDEIVRHDISKLSKVPEINVVEDIHYVNGHGLVKERSQEQHREQELGL